MARKGGSGGGRRSGGHKKSTSKAKHGRQNMRRNMRKGMRQFNRFGANRGGIGKNQMGAKKGGSKMNNFKIGAAMATTGSLMASRHQGHGSGGFGANEESQVEQELAYMSVYDHMDDDGDALQHHLDILSIEG